ncbi:MAG: tRNA 2-thiouridine(34) synthase MnmA [Candidatus Goldbacteria bacterium]|nr:tRNA 2-thiouridine(34) synthase MnmA [Candidatus Goldiibacteriota bacterium]
MKKVFVGMSGGVDSSVAAFLLKEQGFEVVGLTLKLINDASRCCDDDDIERAKKICHKLNIKHYVLNLKREFKNKIINYFISEYLHGRTPNPCALCNEEIKFVALIKKMKEFDFDYVATGHYANIKKIKNGYFLTKGKDPKKTQEYFLARLKKEDLKYIIFPLADLTKEKVKDIALKNKLDLARNESQEVCFLKDNEAPYEFIKKNIKDFSFKTELVDIKGNKIKELEYPYYKYTVGQRKGLGVGGGEPFYVIKINAEEKKVIIGTREQAFSKSFIAKNLNFFINIKSKKFKADVKIRYLHKQAPAMIEIEDDVARITFNKPQFAITPGQLAVFYKKDAVIGSGFIEL